MCLHSQESLRKDELVEIWHARLLKDCPNQTPEQQRGIVCWLLGEGLERVEKLTPNQLSLAKQAIDNRYKSLRQRYLEVDPARAYCNLINRLGSLIVLHRKIRAYVVLSQDRKRTLANVIQEVIQEMLKSDPSLQQQIAWIARCTQEVRLRDALLLSSIEEHCLRPIRNQPLLIYRLVNFLERSQQLVLTGSVSP